MGAARKLTIWEGLEALSVGLQSVPAANDNSIRVLAVAGENSRLGIFVFAHTSLPACEPANDGIAAEKSEEQRITAAEPGITGKEEDVEVGLQYFGKRYLNPLLGRWVSADPLAIHAPGEADLNVYAYVSGTILKSVDPLGLEKEHRGTNGDGSVDFNPNRSAQPSGSGAGSGSGTPGGTSPAPGGGKEQNNGIGDPNASPITDPNDPLNGNLDGASGKGAGDAKGSTPGAELGILGNLAAGAGVVSGEDPLSNAPNASPLGIPGGFGKKENGSRAAQGAYVAGVAASEGWFGRIWSGAKKIWGKIEKVGDLFRPKLSNDAARDWYNARIDTIDSSGPLTRENAHRVSNERAKLKQRSRDRMADRAAAEDLPPVQGGNYYEKKYRDEGYEGEALWSKMIEKSKVTNAEVNKRYGTKKK
jgi:RHS repeat-associated protein